MRRVGQTGTVPLANRTRREPTHQETVECAPVHPHETTVRRRRVCVRGSPVREGSSPPARPRRSDSRPRSSWQAPPLAFEREKTNGRPTNLDEVRREYKATGVCGRSDSRRSPRRTDSFRVHDESRCTWFACRSGRNVHRCHSHPLPLFSAHHPSTAHPAVSTAPSVASIPPSCRVVWFARRSPRRRIAWCFERRRRAHASTPSSS